MVKTVVKNGTTFIVSEITVRKALDILELYNAMNLKGEDLDGQSIGTIIASIPNIMSGLISIDNNSNNQITDMLDVPYSVLEELVLELIEVNDSFLERMLKLGVIQEKNL